MYLSDFSIISALLAKTITEFKDAHCNWLFVPTALPQETIGNALTDIRKQLLACVWAIVGRFDLEHEQQILTVVIIWYAICFNINEKFCEFHNELNWIVKSFRQ